MMVYDIKRIEQMKYKQVTCVLHWVTRSASFEEPNKCERLRKGFSWFIREEIRICKTFSRDTHTKHDRTNSQPLLTISATFKNINTKYRCILGPLHIGWEWVVVGLETIRLNDSYQLLRGAYWMNVHTCLSNKQRSRRKACNMSRMEPNERMERRFGRVKQHVASLG